MSGKYKVLPKAVANTEQLQRHSQGGAGVLVTLPPFCKPFLSKQPTTGGVNDMTMW